MIALKLLLVVALAYTTIAETDLDLAYKMSECLRKAIWNGLPSVHIPTHNPLTFNHNLSWSGDVGVASAVFNLTDIVVHGIPYWNVSLHQYPSKEESQVAFFYNLRWQKLVLTSKYKLKTSVVLIPGQIQGDLNITLHHTGWHGAVNFTKPGFNKTEKVDYLDLSWTTEKVHFDFTGLGIINHPVSNALSDLMKAYFDSEALDEPVGKSLMTKLNTVWFAHNDRIDKIIEFCKANETVSQ